MNNMFMYRLGQKRGGGSSGGGGAEIKTCTVEISTYGASVNRCLYMKQENGAMSFVEGSGYSNKFTLDNVVCNSIFWLYYGAPNGWANASVTGDIRYIGGCCEDHGFYIGEATTECTIFLNGAGE